MAALEITLKADKSVDVRPFIAQVEDESMEAGDTNGIGDAHITTKRDNTITEQSLLMAKNIAIKAEHDINIRGSILSALEELNIHAGRDVNITEEQIKHYVKTESFSAAISFFGSSAITALIAKDCQNAADSLLREFPIFGSAEDTLNATDGADASANVIKAAYESYKLFNSMAGQVANLGEALKGRVNLIPSLRLGYKTTEQFWTQALLTFMKARAINIVAGRDINSQGGQIKAEEGNFKAGRHVNLESAKEKEKNRGIDAGISYQFATQTFGVDFQLNKGESVRHTNTNVDIDNKLTITAGSTIALRGANATATKILLEAKKLEMESLQDTQKSLSVGGSVSSTSVSGNFSSSNKGWVGKQTGITALDEFIGHIEETTHLKGAFIDAARGILETKELIEEELEDRDEGFGLGFGLTDLPMFSQQQGIIVASGPQVSQATYSTQDPHGKDKDKSSAIVGLGDAHYRAHDKRRKNRATVGGNIKIITESNIENLNRDLAAAQKLTKDKKVHVRIVVPLVKDFGQLKKDVEQIQEDLSRRVGEISDSLAEKLTLQSEIVGNIDAAEELSDEQKFDLLQRVNDLQNQADEIDDLKNENDNKTGKSRISVQSTGEGSTLVVACDPGEGTDSEEKSFSGNGKEKDKTAESYTAAWYSSQTETSDLPLHVPSKEQAEEVPEETLEERKGKARYVAKKIRNIQEEAKKLAADYPNVVKYGMMGLQVGSVVVVGIAAVAAAPVAGAGALITGLTAAGTAVMGMQIQDMAISAVLDATPAVLEYATGQTPEALIEKASETIDPLLTRMEKRLGMTREDTLTFAGVGLAIAEVAANKRKGGAAPQRGGHHHNNNTTTTTTTTTTKPGSKVLPVTKKSHLPSRKETMTGSRGNYKASGNSSSGGAIVNRTPDKPALNVVDNSVVNRVVAFETKHGKKAIQNMTDVELAQSLANRAERINPGVKGPKVGTEKHKYAERVWDRYQEMTGKRLELVAEKRYKGGLEWKDGMGLKDSIKPDLYNKTTKQSFDYKFGDAKITSPQRARYEAQLPEGASSIRKIKPN